MQLNRRELIAAMLGAPALLGGCTGTPVLPPAGELFGQSMSIGHRLRDGFRPVPSAGNWQEADVVIVGGGIAGLSAAWKLMQGGCREFIVLELEHVAGGTSQSGKSEVSAYPWGAHYLPVPLAENKLLIQLLREMGVVESLAADGSPITAEQFLCRDPDERLFYQGHWIEGIYPSTGATADDLAQLAAFRKEIDRWVEWRDGQGRRAFAIPTRQASDDPSPSELDRLSMADWLRQQGWSSPRLNWLVDYSCRDDYGLTAEQTSAWAGILYFAARQKAAGNESQPLMTWPEGNGRVVDYLSKRVGSRITTGAAVTQIAHSEAKDRPLEVVWINTRTQEVTGIKAKRVIFAAPQFLASRLIDPIPDRPKRTVDQFQYGSWFVANLHLKDRPRERSFPLSWDNVIHASRSLGYVVATHQSGRDHGPTVLTWYFALSDADARKQREYLFAATWSDLAEVVLTDLEKPHPEIRSLTTRLDIFRWGHAMIQPKPGFISSHQRRAAAQPYGQIHFANTDLSGIALLEEALDHGCRAADEVLAALV